MRVCMCVCAGSSNILGTLPAEGSCLTQARRILCNLPTGTASYQISHRMACPEESRARAAQK